MASRTETLDALDEVWASLDDVLGALGADEWETPSLCPDWTVRGVVAHLAGIEHMLAEWSPGSGDESLPFHLVGEFMASTRDLAPPGLLERYRHLVDVRRRQLRALGDDEWDGACPTPVGMATYGRFMAIRVFDFYVHEQDIRVPLGRPGHLEGAAATMAIDEVHGSLGFIAGKKIGLPDGFSMRVRLTGSAERSLYVSVDGRAKVVPHVDDPTVTLTADPLTFLLLACGRIDPDEPIADGNITWSGDAEWGERAARHLRFTM